MAALLAPQPARLTWHVVQQKDGTFEIWSPGSDTGPGRVVARGIERNDDAYRWAAAPLLQGACSEVAVIFSDAVESGDFEEEFSKPSATLNMALQAAKPPGGRGGESDPVQEKRE